MRFGIFSNGFRPHTSAAQTYDEVLVEKVVPFGRLVPRLAGIVFVAGGAWLLTQNA
jgi:hypothetical protein